MNQAQAFVRKPGTGALFPEREVPDTRNHRVVFWQGPLALPGGKTVQIRAAGYTRLGKYKLSVHEYNSWKTIAEGEVPTFDAAEQELRISAKLKKKDSVNIDYVETRLKIDGRSYIVRISRPAENTGFMHVNLPQVAKAREASRYVV